MTKIYLIRFFLLTVIFSTIAYLQAQLMPQLPPTTIANTPNPYTTYDPATYGLPDTIAGYEILAVLTPQNTACMLPGKIELILQVPVTHNNFFTGVNPGIVDEELAKLKTDSTIYWGVQYIGTGISKEEVLFENEQWNTQFSDTGCETLGGIDDCDQC